MNITANIRNAIHDKGLLQGVVASKAGFSPKQFSSMLAGRKIIRAEYIPRIAEALQCTPNELYDYNSSLTSVKGDKTND